MTQLQQGYVPDEENRPIIELKNLLVSLPRNWRETKKNAAAGRPEVDITWLRPHSSWNSHVFRDHLDNGEDPGESGRESFFIARAGTGP